MTGLLGDRIALRRVLAVETTDHRAHVEALGPLPDVGSAAIVHAVAEAGLTGRGGAGFPTARKLSFVARSGRGVVVANGAEGEPASSKDAVLLATAPHLVLDGLTLAARAASADRIALYAPGDTLARLRRAVAQRSDMSGLQLVASPDTFVSGQASAVASAVDGRPAVPVTAPPSPRERGVAGRPTAVMNVETLAHLGLIARFGPSWFRQVGTSDEPGTRLLTVSGSVRAPGVYEVCGGSGLDEIVTLAGGVSQTVQALLVGGYHGGWVPWGSGSSTTTLTGSALAPYGAAPGAGVIVALPAARCPIEASEQVVAYLAGQSVGQCGPCRNGLPSLAAHVGQLARGRATATVVAEIERIAGLVEGRGACHHPDGTARFVASTMRAFADDVHAHLAGRCLTGTSLGRRR